MTGVIDDSSVELMLVQLSNSLSFTDMKALHEWLQSISSIDAATVQP
jgi:hypothetical protein